ncbi:uncharacterized protein [Panulirus ornatus]
MGGQGRGTPSVKGVGGYRPTVNWREISIRRKSVADRQVLSCIVVCGVFIIMIGSIMTILALLVISSQCPFMWVEGSGSCYYVAGHNASWQEGHSYCHSQSASLLHLHSTQQTLAILKLMLGRSWLGLRRGRGQEEWAWSTGAKLNYTRWQNPSDATNQRADLCAAMDETGEWLVLACHGEDQAYVICDFIPGYNPFVLVGPVVIFCGVVVLVLSIEVCIRRREFMEKNPEVMIAEEGEDDRQVDAGLINYGYGHFTSDDTAKTVTWPQVDASSPSKSQQVPSSSGILKVASPRESTDGGGSGGGGDGGDDSGPRVHIVPASLPVSPSLTGPPPEENSHSQEQLELLLSPKTLE